MATATHAATLAVGTSRPAKGAFQGASATAACSRSRRFTIEAESMSQCSAVSTSMRQERQLGILEAPGKPGPVARVPQLRHLLVILDQRRPARARHVMVPFG